MSTVVDTGDSKTVITANATTQIKTSGGKLGHLLVWGVGTAWVLDFYDHASANTTPTYKWVTADGIGAFPLQLPMSAGIRVVSSGTTPGNATVVWA